MTARVIPINDVDEVTPTERYVWTPTPDERAAERIRRLRIRGASREVAELIAHAALDETAAAVRSVRAWMKTSSRPWLVLCGGLGCGKTLASYIAIDAGQCRGELVGSMTLAQQIAPWGAEAERFRAIDADDSPLIVLDDLGTETLSSRWIEAFAQLLKARDGKPMIVTTNLHAPEIEARYGGRVRERINHDGRVVEIAETSRRRGDGGL